MKLLETAHGYFVTGSEIADAVIQCHAERAAAFQIDTVEVPIVDGLGVRGSVCILVGGPYAIASATIASPLSELQEEILTGLSTGGYWLTANDGEGERREAHLLLHPGVPLTLIPVPDLPD